MGIKCPDCLNEIVGGQDMCFRCGYKLSPDTAKFNKKTNEPNYSVFRTVDKYKTDENTEYNFERSYGHQRKGKTCRIIKKFLKVILTILKVMLIIMLSPLMLLGLYGFIKSIWKRMKI